jgi:hypothetical protein
MMLLFVGDVLKPTPPVPAVGGGGGAMVVEGGGGAPKFAGIPVWGGGGCALTWFHT